MKQAISTLSGNQKILLYFQILLLLLPSALFLFLYIYNPDYYNNLIKNLPFQPMGWIIVFITLLLVLAASFLAWAVAKNYQRYTIIKKSSSSFYLW